MLLLSQWTIFWPSPEGVSQCLSFFSWRYSHQYKATLEGTAFTWVWSGMPSHGQTWSSVTYWFSTHLCHKDAKILTHPPSYLGVKLKFFTKIDKILLCVNLSVYLILDLGSRPSVYFTELQDLKCCSSHQLNPVKGTPWYSINADKNQNRLIIEANPATLPHPFKTIVNGC